MIYLNGLWTFKFLQVCVGARTCSVPQFWSTLWDPMDCSPQVSAVHGIFQARTPEWVAISFARGSSQPRDWTCVSCVSCFGRQIFYYSAPWEAHFISVLYSQIKVILCQLIWPTPKGKCSWHTQVAAIDLLGDTPVMLHNVQQRLLIRKFLVAHYDSFLSITFVFNCEGPFKPFLTTMWLAPVWAMRSTTLRMPPLVFVSSFQQE